MTGGIVIAGGGLAAQRCAETLRRSGYDGRLRMVCAERHRPYDRPPLSKAVLADSSADDGLAFRPQAWYEDRGIELELGVPAAALAPDRRALTLVDGRTLDYEQLLIATGSRPRPLPALDGFANVQSLRTVDDARTLRAALAAGGRLAILGAGFIGQEVAAAAAKAGVQATIIEAADAPLQAVVGPAIGSWFADLHRTEGVEVVLGAHVTAAHGAGRVRTLELSDGRRIDCDHVVVGIGAEPDLAWLAGSGLDTTGVRVDEHGRAAAPGVLAAGDAAATYDAALDRYVAGGHWEPAGRQGAAVARTMLGLEQPHAAPASFWSDLYDTRVQYLGHAPLADAMSIDGDPSRRDFGVTYTRAGEPVAVLLVGRPRHLPRARALLAA